MRFQITGKDFEIRHGDIIQAMKGIEAKYFTIEEVQTLNKFYSTDEMQSMVKKRPAFMREIAQKQIKLSVEFQKRLVPIVNQKLAQNR